MKSKFILFIALVLSTSTFAQDFGYLGNKNSVTLTGTFSPRLIGNLFARSNYYNTPSWPVSVGGTFRFERQLNIRNFIGLEFGYTNTGSRLPYVNSIAFRYSKNPDIYAYSELEYHQPIRVNVFAPTFTYSRAYSGNLAPIGIVNTMGGGILIAKPIVKDYDYAIQSNYYYNNYSVDPQLFPGLEEEAHEHIYSPAFTKSIFGLRFFWQTSLNVPLAPHILWTASVRGNINVYFPILFQRDSNNDSEYIINDTSFKQHFAKSELFNMLELSTGLKITF